jgi:hypothetical protein
VAGPGGGQRWSIPVLDATPSDHGESVFDFLNRVAGEYWVHPRQLMWPGLTVSPIGRTGPGLRGLRECAGALRPPGAGLYDHMLPRDHLAVSYGSATHYSRETQ